MLPIILVTNEQNPIWVASTERVLERINSNPRVLPENKQHINDFVVYLRARGSMPATVWRHVYCYEKLVNAFDSSADILKARREEIVAAVAKIEALPIGEITRAKIKITLKFMYKHFNGEDVFYPREVAWVKGSVRKKSRIMPSDLLSLEEIDSMIDNSRNLRDRAIIALMADAPLRTHELLLLKRKHLVIDSDQPFLVVPEDTKTGTRRIPLINSIPYLVQYLDAFKAIEPEDPLFMHELWNSERKPLKFGALRIMLKKVAKRAGIKKRIYPYLFRHGVITRYANKLSNAQLEKVAGWQHGTNMHMTYEHLSDLDLSKAIANANGVKIKEDKEEKPRIKVCGRCKYTNAKDSQYCARCGSALSVEIALQEERDKQSFDEAMARYLSDPKHFEEAVHKMQFEDYRRRRR
jgi:integrase/recombinase XerD